MELQHRSRCAGNYMHVSKWLGHRTFILTLTTYAGYINEDEQATPKVGRGDEGERTAVGAKNRFKLGAEQRTSPWQEPTHPSFGAYTGRKTGRHVRAFPELFDYGVNVGPIWRSARYVKP